MVTKSLFSIVSIAITLLLSQGCHSSPQIQLPVYYDENPEYTPDDMGTWETLLCRFSEGSCCGLWQIEAMSGTPEIPAAAGDRIAGAVFSSRDNLSFGDTVAGKEAARYYIRRSPDNLEVPQIWAFSTVTDGGDAHISAPLRPVTSQVTLEVTPATDDIDGLQLILPYSYDTYYLEQSRLECTGPRTEAILSFPKEGGTKCILPMADEGLWILKVAVKTGDEDILMEIPVDAALCRGRDMNVSMDFTKLRKEGRISALTRVRDRVSHKELFSGTSVYNPEKEMPALSSDYYRVYVADSDGSWKEVAVGDALCSDAVRYHSFIWNDWDNSRALRDTMSYAIFEHPFDAPVKVRIKKLSGSFSSCKVRPSDYGITAVNAGDNTVELTLPSYQQRKVSVEFDGDRFHNLFLLPGRPDQDKPDANDPNVKYFGPGEHDAGTIVLRSNQTLYIDYGAVVYGEVTVAGDDCTIAGHGVLSGQKLPHMGETWSTGDILVNCNPYRKPERSRLTVRDISFIDSPSWTLSVYNYDGVTIDNINMICWILNGDGIDVVSSRNVEIKNCFLRCYDDCITLKVRHNADPVSDLCNVWVHDNVCWNDYARGIVVGIEAGNVKYGTGCIHDVLIEDCIILENARSSATDDLRAAFAIGQYASPDYSWAGGTACDMWGITARRISFDNLSPSARCVFLMQYPDMDAGCKMSDITLEDFHVSNGLGNRNPIITIRTNQHSIENLQFINFTVDGVKITSRNDSRVSVSGNADIQFK